MKIARIAELNKSFLVIFEDGTELRLSEEVYFTCAVYEKEEMSSEEIDRLVFKEKVTDGLIICKKYLAGGLKPKNRLFAYLKNKNVEIEAAKEIIGILEKENYLDDIKYAKKKVKRKMITSPVSSRMLAVYLENDGIEHDIAEMVVAKARIDDKKNAAKLAAKKIKSAKGDKRKTAVYLISKGFDEDTILEVLGREDLWNE